jgi:hypothetical protein
MMGNLTGLLGADIRMSTAVSSSATTAAEFDAIYAQAAMISDVVVGLQARQIHDRPLILRLPSGAWKDQPREKLSGVQAPAHCGRSAARLERTRNRMFRDFIRSSACCGDVLVPWA